MAVTPSVGVSGATSVKVSADGSRACRVAFAVLTAFSAMMGAVTLFVTASRRLVTRQMTPSTTMGFTKSFQVFFIWLWHLPAVSGA